MKRALLILAAILFSSNMLLAQHTVTGTLIDESNNERLMFVNIGLLRSADSVFVSGAASDDKGFFKMVQVPTGQYFMQITAIGYENYRQDLEINADLDLGTIKMKQGSMRLDEVVITEKRPLFAVDGEKNMYNVAEDPSIQTGTLSDALQNAPGVQVDVEGNITLRGTSSVEVWINDKPSHMTAENLKTYIQTLPANSIDRVEVITNPSARYGSKADGIINIVTNAKIQKNQFFSFGSYASTRPSVTPWMSYVWSNNKLTVNAYVNGGYSVWKGDRSNEQSLYLGPGMLANHQIDSIDYDSKNFNTGGYFSIDYEIDTANSLNFWISGWPNWGDNKSGTTFFREEFLPDTLTTDISERTKTNGNSFYANGGLYYRHKFDNKGHNLSVSINGMGWGENESGDLTRTYTSPISYIHQMRHDHRTSASGVSGEVIYNRPYSSNGEIAVGISTDYSSERQYTNTDTIADDVWNKDIYRSYKANFYNMTNEAFVTLQHRFGGFTVKPGLRFVSELVKGAYPDSTQYDFSKHFFSLRPSIHLSYRTKSMHNFNLSYTRRIAAPSAEELSMFPLYHIDDYSTGNPDLERVYTHSVEAGWTKYWDGFGSVGLSSYYRAKTNEVNEIQLSRYHWLYGRVVPYSFPVNVGKSHQLGFSYNMMYRPNGFFNLRFYANLYNSYLETVFDNEEYTQNSWSYSFNLNMWAKLWNKIEVTASGYYSSPSKSLFSEWHARYGVNAGLKADFLDRKLSVFVNANDIFNTNSWGESNFSPYVQSSSDSRYNSRSVSVGITFRFGKMELEQHARQGSESDGAGGAMGAGN